MRIHWKDLSPDLFEDMVAVLLSHLYPHIKRLDGSGGDKGRDSHFKSDTAHDIYQMKYFPFRLGDSQRRQIKRSLERAEKLGPTSWTLIVPIDLTEAEEKWFSELVKDKAFKCEWKGKTWLDARFAEKVFIARYFLEGTDAEVVEALKELSSEQAALANGLPDAMGRLQTLAARLNSLDPYWQFDLSISGDTSTITPRPRFAGADEESPITVRVRLAFPDTDEGHAALQVWEEATGFGTPAEASDELVQEVIIEGPAGLSTSFTGGSLTLGPSGEPFSLLVRLRVLSPDDVQLAELPITFTEKSSGLHGVIATGHDRSQSLHVRLRIDMEAKRVNVTVNFSPHPGALPAELLPALRFLAAFGSPNKYVMADASSGVPMSESHSIGMDPLVQEDFVQLVEQLAELQDQTHIHFPLPQEFTQKDYQELQDALQLLSGEVVRRKWNTMRFTLTREGWKKAEKELRRGEPKALRIQQNYEAEIAGNSVPIGSVLLELRAAEITNRDDILAAISSGSDEDSVSAVLRPAEGDEYELRLLIES